MLPSDGPRGTVPQEDMTVPKQGDLSLLEHPVARELLESTHLARLAYIASDGSPRVVPIWFHWTGSELVVAGWPTAPKVRALSPSGRVAVTIDSEGSENHALLIRGTATPEIVDGVPTEYRAAAARYLGEEGGAGWVADMEKMFPQMARIPIRPEWVGVIDFEERFPNGLARAMAAGGAAG